VASSALSASRYRNTRPREQQVRGIGARNQPHQAHRGKREAGERVDVADQVGLEVFHVPRGLVVLVGRLPDREQRLVDRVQLAGGQRPIGAAREPGDHRVEEWTLAPRWRELLNQEQVEIPIELAHCRRHDADQRVLGAVEANGLADRVCS
jgi:hypothetical protein